MTHAIKEFQAHENDPLTSDIKFKVVIVNDTDITLAAIITDIKSERTAQAIAAAFNRVLSEARAITQETDNEETTEEEAAQF